MITIKVSIFIEKEFLEESNWIMEFFPIPVQIDSIDTIVNEESKNSLKGIDTVIFLGLDEGKPWVLPYEVITALWEYVEDGGVLYAENLSCYEFPISRLFGFQQDYPSIIRSSEKLRVESSLLGERSGSLLEWEGHYQKGFTFEGDTSETLLSIGTYMQTHIAEKAISLQTPGLIYRLLGKGRILYSAFSMLTTKNKLAYRPNWLWNEVLTGIEAKLNIPLNSMPKYTFVSNRLHEQALEEAATWFLKSGILPKEDGSKGVYENIHSLLKSVTKDHRPDCHAHTALMFYLYSEYTGDREWEQRAHNLMDYLFQEGYQDTDKNSVTYGFWKWYRFPGRYPEHIFTDDNSWVCFVLLYLYKRTGNEEYKKRGLMTAEALLRTQHDNGLRAEQLQGTILHKEGIEQAKSIPVSMNPHFESMAHVAFLQAYQVTKDEQYLETAYRGTKYLLEHHEEMKWMYSRTSVYARFLLAISTLLRYKSDPELKEGLMSIINFLKKQQHVSGGIEEADNPDPERYGTEDTGVYLYNGEGISDLLYTNNFLLMNLWETWKATGEKEYYEFYQELRDFVSAVQIESEDVRFNGGWMRSFDLNHKEYFGNNGDTGWGPYCIESGWTTAITSVGLLIGTLDISLFE